MNYQMLKSIVDSLMQNFKCPDCSSGVGEKEIEIVGAAGKTINIDISCPNCSKHTMVKAEVSSVNIGNMLQGGRENIENLKNELMQKLSSLKGVNEIRIDKKESSINEKEIKSLREKLKNDNVSVSDFFA